MGLFKRIFESVMNQNNLPSKWMEYFIDGKSLSDLSHCVAGFVVSYGMDGSLLTRYPGYIVFFKNGSGRLFDVSERYMKVDADGQISHQKLFQEKTEPLELMSFPLLKHSWEPRTIQAPEFINRRGHQFSWLSEQFHRQYPELNVVEQSLVALSFVRTIERDGRYVKGWEFIGVIPQPCLAFVTQ